MNPKLPLDGRIYTLTVGSVLTTNVAISNQSMPAFVQIYSQTRARLMFVTTLEMDNFDCTKMNARFQKFTACLREGLIHEWKQALLAPPLPLMSLNNSRFCSTHSHRTAPLAWLYRTSGKLRILVKAQPST